MGSELTDVADLQSALEKKHQEWRVDQVLLKSYANTIGELRAENARLQQQLTYEKEERAQAEVKANLEQDRQGFVVRENARLREALAGANAYIRGSLLNRDDVLMVARDALEGKGT